MGLNSVFLHNRFQTIKTVVMGVQIAAKSTVAVRLGKPSVVPTGYLASIVLFINIKKLSVQTL